MRLLRYAPILALIVVVGCGSKSPVKSVRQCPPPAFTGCSIPKTRSVAPPSTAGRTFPDISEYQGCPQFTGPVIFKVYEGGYGQDHSARCNANRVHQLHSWAGVYSFLRPNNCAGQGYATAQIVRQLGGVPGPVVADAEVALPTGCVDRFLTAVRQYLGGPVDVYTSPGTWPGGHPSAPLWVATYGSRPGCVVGICRYVAWQFTDNKPCHAGTPTDCSLDSGILSQTREHRPPPVPPRPAPAEVRIKYLRSLARKHHCYTPSVQRRVRACRVWGTEVATLEGRVVR